MRREDEGRCGGSVEKGGGEEARRRQQVVRKWIKTRIEIIKWEEESATLGNEN